MIDPSKLFLFPPKKPPTDAQSHLSNFDDQQQSLRSTTPKTLVVTLTPNEDSPVKLKDFKRAIREVKDNQKDMCQSQTDTLMKV